MTDMHARTRVALTLKAATYREIDEISRSLLDSLAAVTVTEEINLPDDIEVSDFMEALVTWAERFADGADQ